MKTRVMLAVLLVILPVALSPLERNIDAEREKLRFGGAEPTLALRERLGQGMSIAILAGLRGLVADFLWIQAQQHFENGEWVRLARNIELAATLQPQSVLFWDMGHWYMAWPVAEAVRRDPRNRTQSEGIKREREWLQRAREFLAHGIENVPHRHELYFAMGFLMRERFKDDCAAAEYFGEALKFPKAPTFITRLYGYSLEACGKKHEAYRWWKFLWTRDRDRPAQLWEAVEREGRRLENELKIPQDERVFTE
jgi:hypothetical protein